MMTNHSMKRKLPRILVWSLRVLAALVAVAGAVVLYSVITWDRAVDAPRPPIHADRSPAAIARGAAIFHSTCEVCHRATGSERASGAPVTDAPAFLGTFHAANLTADPTAGIGALSDEDIARQIRFGVGRDGHRRLMPTYAMGDGDIAAVLGFLRSDDPLFRPDPAPAPPSRLSVAGKTLLVLTGSSALPDLPAQGVPVPEKADTVAYGQYLAKDVFDCVGCHTPGFSASKASSPEAFSGGFEFRDPSGKPVPSRNLTPDETGIAHYSREDLARALRRGQRPDGSVLSAPMPMFRGLDDVDVSALYTYLRSLPPRRNDGEGRTPRPSAEATAARAKAATPAERFHSLGCVGCHGAGAAHARALVKAQDRPAEDLARWIRNPERFVPGTPMPTYEDLLDEPGALELAAWIKGGGPGALSAR